jgi:EmrB/QacA subfamily drug resistance transporter
MFDLPPKDDALALDRETMIVAGVVLLGAVMSLLDATVVNVALDKLSTDFDAPFTTIQWVVSAYTLALAAVIPATGWASDRFGEKRVYLSALGAFTFGSALCALAWSPGSLIAFRILQGLGGGMVLPCVMTIISRKAGPGRRGRVMGILGIPLLVAPMLGAVLGGWLVDAVSWRAIFFINLPIGVLAIALAWVVLEPSRPQRDHRLDWLGLGLLSPGLALLIFGFAESPSHGFGAARTWLPIVVGGLLIAAFFVHSRRAEEPLIDVKTFVGSPAGTAAIILLLLVVSLAGVMLLMPIYFQVARGTSALQSGLLLAPQGIGAMLMTPLAGWLTDRLGPSWLPACSLPLLIIGLAPFAVVTDSTPLALLCAFNLLVGFGCGLAFTPTMTAALQAVPEGTLARTSTALNAIDQSAASIGTALLAVLLAGATAGVIPGADGGLNAVERLSEAQRAAFAGPLSTAFATTFLCADAVLVVALVPALVLALGHRRAARAPLSEPAPAR